MNTKNICFFWALSCFIICSCNKKSNHNLSDFPTLKLVSISNDTLDFSTIDQHLANVFIFMTPECPIAQKYTLELEQLHQEFKEQNISFHGVFNGKIGLKESAVAFPDKYNISFPFLKDEDNHLKYILSARISPEVFVLDSNNQIIYKGKIDNWFFGLGKKRKVITEFYLKDALTSLVKGEEIKVPETKAVGCYLTD